MKIKKILELKPLWYLVIYVSAILVYALMYWCIPDILTKEVILLDAFYFSVVTITTLGYGDFAPALPFGKVLVMTQTLLGILLFGLFLNSASAERVRIQNERKRSGLKTLVIENYERYRAHIMHCIKQHNHLPEFEEIEPQEYKEIQSFRKVLVSKDRENWDKVMSKMMEAGFYHDMEQYTRMFLTRQESLLLSDESFNIEGRKDLLDMSDEFEFNHRISYRFESEKRFLEGFIFNIMNAGGADEDPFLTNVAKL